MMRVFRNSRLIAAVAIVAGILAFALRPSAMEVDVARVTRGPMQVTIDEEGETRVRERFVVSAPVAGRLHRIELEPGDTVISGTTVVARLTSAASPLIDTRTQAELSAALAAARAAVGQARAERDRAAAALARTTSSLTRQEALAHAGAISRDEVESAQAAMKTTEESLRAAEFAVARADRERQLAQARLTPSAAGGRTVDVVAPVNGVVLKRLRESEAVVPVGDPLVEIGDPASLEIVADFLSTDAVRIPPGAKVLIDEWGGDMPLDGRVRRVEPSGFMKVSALGVEEQRVNVIIDFADVAAAREHLGDGYRVEVRVIIWREESTLRVPIGSVFRQGEGWAAFLVDGGRARVRTLTLGQRNDTAAEVLAGVSEGQTVVLHPPDTLVDGARVKVRAAGRTPLPGLLATLVFGFVNVALLRDHCSLRRPCLATRQSLLQ